MAAIGAQLTTRWPALSCCPEAVTWLQLQGDLGLAPRTIDAYARALADYLTVCQRDGRDPVVAGRAEIARYVRDLAARPNQRGPNVVALDSGVGLANATLQQRLVAVRLFYDRLIEEGHRETNPVGRGRYTPGHAFGGQRERGLVPRFTKLPWIPSDEQWRQILESASVEPLRNRLMLALAYDAGLLREELCLLRSDDLDPAHRMLRVRAETTKNRRERVVPYSTISGMLLRQYFNQRACGLSERRCQVGRDQYGGQGLGWHERPRPPSSEELVQATRRYYEFTIEEFGVDRCRFESNFPVDKVS